MKFIETALKDAYIINPTPSLDERGGFMRSFCKKEFQSNNLPQDFVQCNISYNHKKGTLRGMHFQKAPFEEGKLVRCIRGAIYDVIIDLRRESSTFGKYFGINLSAENKISIYIPVGFAHGFLTLMDDTDVFYQMTEYYHPSAAQGYRWNDPFFKIDWPISNPIISSKDNSFPDFVS